MPYAEVAVDAPLRDGRLFTYEIPPQISVAPGQMVQVPFGPRMADGMVFKISATTRIDPVRPIETTDPWGPVLTSEQLELARWISDYYLAPLYSAVALMLPPGFRNRTASNLAMDASETSAPPKDREDSVRASILARFTGRRTTISEATLRQAVGPAAQRALDRLIRYGVITRKWTWRRPRIPSEQEQPVSDEGLAPQASLTPTPHQPEASLTPPPHQPEASLTPTPHQPEASLTPTPHQREALDQITAAIQAHQYQAFLLQGVTGSGKTEVYLQALARCLEDGREGIVLVPEISLTPQTVRRFQARFPGQVAVIHSRLSTSEHREMWWGLFHGRYKAVVGSRSALFAPVHPLGLVIIDEEHEWTYKQQDAQPRYHSRSVAMRMAQQTGAVVVLGSATPDVVVYNRAQSGQRLRLLELPYRLRGEGQAGHSPLAQVHVVDMRTELREGHRGIFSRLLQTELADTLARGEQAIVFINRRGAAGVVQCRDCGHVARCRSCDSPLTYHSETERLICHQCNRRHGLMTTCPDCRSQRVRHLGLGTQRVVSELESLCPGVSVLRWDRDVAANPQAYETVLDSFTRGDAQVLVGTQMVAKGLHVPSVTLVGAVLADIGLHLPEFRAAERVFQLLCQVAGRAGRGERAGTAIVQTYLPDHYAIAMAAEQDYPGFYRQEVAFRRAQRLPPYSRLIRLLFTHTNSGLCERDAERMARALRRQRQAWSISEVDMMGPAPAYPTRIRGRYRWHIILRGPDPRLLLDKVDIPEGCQVDVDPVSVL